MVIDNEYVSKKNRNLISHCPIFVIKISKKCYQYLKLYVDRRNITIRIFFLNPVVDYAKIASRLNSDKIICGVLEDDCRLPEDVSSEKESDSFYVFSRKIL